MHTLYRTNRLDLRILPVGNEDIVLKFYEENRSFFEPTEPKRVPGFYTLDFQRKNLAGEYNGFAKGEYFRYWIFFKDNNLIPIGTVSFTNIRKVNFSSCLVGYKLDERVCNQGYMTEALQTLISKMIREYHLHRIEAAILPENQSSIKLVEKLGFVYEGLLHSYAEINGSRRDHLLYTFLPDYNNK